MTIGKLNVASGEGNWHGEGLPAPPKHNPIHHLKMSSLRLRGPDQDVTGNRGCKLEVASGHILEAF